MIEHTPGELSVTAQQDGFFVVPVARGPCKEVVGNVAILTLAQTAPHECDNPECPGDVNRRRLEAFEGLLAACTDVAKGLRRLRDAPPPAFESATELSALWVQLSAACNSAAIAKTPE